MSFKIEITALLSCVKRFDIKKKASENFSEREWYFINR